jgi:hypothetical protein
VKRDVDSIEFQLHIDTPTGVIVVPTAVAAFGMGGPNKVRSEKQQ